MFLTKQKKYTLYKENAILNTERYRIWDFTEQRETLQRKPQEKNKRLVVTGVCCRTVGVWLSRYQILFPSLVSNSIVSNSCERQKSPSRTSSSFQFPKISGQVPSILSIIYNCCISPAHSYSTKKAAFYVSARLLRTDVLYSPRINVQINITIMIKIKDNKRKLFVSILSRRAACATWSM